MRRSNISSTASNNESDLMTDFLDQISGFSPRRLALLAVKLKDSLDAAQAAVREPIAVIGIGCRFPSADNPGAFWTLLREGRDAIREVPADRWKIDEYFHADPDAPGKMSTRSGGFLDRIDGFDPHFFGIAPREAMVMDPQQRLLLEVSWEALEHAGIAPQRLVGSRTGVFVGICNADYHQLLMARGVKAIDVYLASGSAHSVASGRLSYVLGLQGPALSIDTSCSASLAAIHAACQSLHLNESTLALAGGVNIICAPDTSIALSKGHMLAPDGRCKTFDAAADGFSRAEGCGIVVLKRLSDAQRDGDRILALVRGCAINQDGRSGGLTVPNGPAQEAVIRDALAAAGISAADIGYVEAHGTGTALGDPIEVRALGRVLGEGRDPADPLVIGSVKTNFGHLESAAGIAGFIKVILALHNEEIPSHLHFKTPSPHIEWSSLPVAVATERRAWPRGTRVRRAGVSSFGFSGTNVHAILEEAPAAAEPTGTPDRPQHCLTLSARGERPLRELAQRYADALVPGTGIRLADAAHTAAIGRFHMGDRLAVIAANEAEARTALTVFAAGGSQANIRRGSVAADKESDVVFVYTGAGAQYPGMGQALYDASPIFREAIDRCDALLGADARGLTLKSVLRTGTTTDAPIHEIAWTQPALFALEYALTELWRSWGVEPAAVIGHSVGEYAAACAAGVFPLEDGLRLIAHRGRLMQALPPGGMMAAVFAPVDDVVAAVALVADRVAVAAVNAPENVVISGEKASVKSILAAFAQRNVQGQRLFVSFAAHSPLVEPALDSMEALARTVPMSPPKIPVAWNLGGAAPLADAAPDALYWRRHMRESVRFSDGITALYGEGYRTFLEVGPHPTLIALAKQSLPAHETLLLTSLRRGKDDWCELLTSLADLHVHGVPVDWAGADRPYTRRRVVLPTYPFERDRYWAAPAPQIDRREPPSDGITETRVPDTTHAADSLFYKIEWEPARNGGQRLRVPSKLREGAGERFKAFASEHGFAIYDRLMPELERLSTDYIRDAFIQLKFDATPGRRLSALAEASRLGIAERHHRLFARLLALLAEDGVLQRQGESFVVCRALTGGDPASRCEELLNNFSDADGELRLLRRCGGELARVLRGEQDPLPLLFPSGSLTELQHLYADSPYARTFNGTLADLLSRASASWSEGRPIRVLEIGAGTGGTTTFVLPGLGRRVEYTFTDVSPLFLARAADQFRDYPLLRTALLDIERDPAGQGFEVGGYDVVIAANVLHATANLHQTLTHVGSLLAPGGLLFVAEAVVPERWVDLTFGLTEGWWRFSDATRGPGGPLLNRDEWRRSLAEVGFADIVDLPDQKRVAGRAAHQALIVAIWPGNSTGRRWLVLADESEIAKRLEPALVAAGDSVTVVQPEAWRPAMTSGEILRRQAWWPAAEVSSANSKTIELVFMGALDSGEGRDAAPDLSSHAALAFLQAAAGVGTGRVWLVTRGAQDVRGADDVIAPDQAAIWGLGRTFALEHPSRWGGLLDLDPLSDAADAALALFSSFRADDGEDQMAWREGERRVARLISMPPPRSGTVSVKPNVSYLVTGGLGGLGLGVANWLAARGARHLVLVGRTPLPPRQDWAMRPADSRIAGIIELERVGATVNTVALDVGNPTAVAALMARFGDEWRPLGGIVHAAVAPTAAPLVEMGPDLLEAMFRTKVQSARLLNTLSASQPVEFFVSFSTTTALLGSAQLAHYAAANAVLDALACRRRAEGRPALSVNWGSWDRLWGVSEDDRARIARGGLLPIPIAVGLAALESLLSAGATRAVVADVDWKVLRAAYESRRPQPILSRLTAAPGGQSTAGAGRPMAPLAPTIDLSSLAPIERRNAIEEAVGREVADVLGLRTPHKVDPALDLFKMGMDSLMAIELRSRLEAVAAATLPSSLAFNYPTVIALAAFLDETIAARAHPADDLEDVSALLNRVDQMSEAEINSLLNKMLPEGSAA
jgi:acyl transferase domain-containing protein/acyl carrier protein